ncbi:thioredoxin family protein [Hyunsoonleella sp. SJ7]|uniref:Thioredoxin family protein n=1 Tax=Hyunsoonleella aquatilis TaxID=2762758 RepID=A0A923HDL9_9FLAO|nr:thioredoxin family protein [Hyunsoonleella aquatilis]MBC3758203.1 thioredoxin family protein [Hyunsoonleella aquatilis]
MDAIIKSAINKSISYPAYRELVKQFALEQATTGNEQTQAHVNFTKLNERRMKRWDKTLKVSESAKKRLEEFDGKITWLVITESWCGDAAHVLPALNKIAEITPNINYRVVLRDDNPKLMDAYLTNGNRAIPKVIIIDDTTGEVIATYGPRPSEAASYVKRFKAMNGQLTPEFKEDLQHWYNSNKGKNVIEDVTEILCRLQPSVCQ